METLLQQKQIDSMMLLLGTMGHDCRRLVGAIKETSRALEAAVELQMKAKNSSISNLQKRCADLQAKNEELEDNVLMMSAKVAEMEGATGARRGEEGVLEVGEEAQQQGSQTGQMGAEPTEREAE